MDIWTLNGVWCVCVWIDNRLMLFDSLQCFAKMAKLTKDTIDSIDKTHYQWKYWILLYLFIAIAKAMLFCRVFFLDASHSTVLYVLCSQLPGTVDAFQSRNWKQTKEKLLNSERRRMFMWLNILNIKYLTSIRLQARQHQECNNTSHNTQEDIYL